MGGGSHDLPRPRARAGRFRSCRCGGRSRPARSDIAVAVAAICGSSASRDPESRQPAADQTELTDSHRYCHATEYVAPHQLWEDFSQLKLVGNEFAGISNPERGKGTDLSSLSRHDVRQAARPSIPGGLYFSEHDSEKREPVFRKEHAPTKG